MQQDFENISLCILSESRSKGASTPATYRHDEQFLSTVMHLHILGSCPVFTSDIKILSYYNV